MSVSTTPSGSYEVRLERLCLPAGVMLAAGAVLAHLPAGVGLPCPLLRGTRDPCPFCGPTTSAMGARFRAAVTAAPLGIAVVAVALLSVAGLALRVLPIPNVVI